MGDQRRGEGLAAGSAEEAREALERVRLGGKRVGLLVGDHLQAVLDAAEMLVGRGQLVARFLADPALGRERIERLERLGRTQRRRAAAGDQLLGLHEKLDLADAAAAELDVVAGDGDLLVAAKGVDLPLHRMHVGDRRMVEVAPPDEGRKLLQERLAGGDIAGAGPRLDEGRALPGLALALVVSVGEVGGDRELGRTRIGPQPADRHGTRSRRKCAPAACAPGRAPGG